MFSAVLDSVTRPAVNVEPAEPSRLGKPKGASEIGVLMAKALASQSVSTLPLAGRVVEAQRIGGSNWNHPVLLVNASVGGEKASILMPKKGGDGGVKMVKGSPLFLPIGTKGNHTLTVYAYDVRTGELSEEVISTRPFYPATSKDFWRSVPGFTNASALGQIASGATDIPSLAAQIDQLVNTEVISELYAGLVGEPELVEGLEHLSHAEHGPDLGLQNGFGLSSIGGVGTGVLRLISAANQMESAQRINDVGGKQIASLRLTRGVLETANSFVSGTSRILTVPQIATAANVSKVAHTVLQKSGTALGVAYSLFIVAPLALNAVKSLGFTKKIDEIMNGHQEKSERVGRAVADLMGQLQVSAEEKQKVIANLPKDIGTLYTMVSQGVRLHEDEADILTVEDRREIQAIVDTGIQALQEKDAYALISNWGEARENLAICVMKEWAHLKMIRKAKYLRRAGIESYEMLKKELARPDLYRLVNRLEDPVMLKKAEEIVEIAKGEATANIYTAVFLAVAITIGISAVIVATVASGGIPVVVGLILGLISTLMITAIDTKSFITELKEMKDSSTTDRVIIVAFAALALISMVVGAMQAASPIGLAVVIVGGSIMLGMHAATLVTSYQAQAAAKEKREREAQERIHYNGYTRKELEMFE